MRKTTNSDIPARECIAVDIYKLMELLSCGETTARFIAKQACARIDCNSQRALYSTEKIREYTYNHSN